MGKMNLINQNLMVISFLIFSKKNLKGKNSRKKVNMSPFLMKYINKFKRMSANFLKRNKEGINKEIKTVIFILFFSQSISRRPL